MLYAARIVDAVTLQGLPGATVELWVDNLMLVRGASDNQGYVTLSSGTVPKQLRISNVGYQSRTIPFVQAQDESLFALQRDVKELPNVIIDSMKTKPAYWLLGMLAFLLLVKRR